ncbi:MAG TPA: hypothetical protein VL572_10410, partial [Pyrinomonadaceae bacterium]|nr:hypothetical protein [Pyrinomonadaceae bacterium]
MGEPGEGRDTFTFSLIIRHVSLSLAINGSPASRPFSPDGRRIGLTPSPDGVCSSAAAITS